MNIEYGLMIDTRKRVQVFSGAGASYVSNPRNFSARFKYLHMSSINDTWFQVVAYASSADRASDVNRQAVAYVAFATTPVANVELAVLSGGDPKPVLDIVSSLNWLTLNHNVDVAETGYTDEDVGIFNSSMCLVTGRPGFQSGGNVPGTPPENPMTMADQLTWKEGLIAANSLGSPGQYVDPSLGGGYSTMSGAELRLINNAPGLEGDNLFDYLGKQGIDLFRCELRFYVILEGAMHLWGTYEIEEISNEEHYLRLLCVDKALTLHKDILKTEVSKAGFPAAPEDSQGKFIPLCIGRVPEAQLLPVTGSVVWATLVHMGTATYQVARVTIPLSDTSFMIYTGTQTIPNLAGKYIRVARAGTTASEYSIVKVASSTSTTVAAYNTNFATIYLESPFLDKDNKVTRPTGASMTTPTAMPNAWWVQAYDLANFGAVSDSPVAALPSFLKGIEDNVFINVDGQKIASYLDGNSAYGGIAGISARPEGDMAPLQPQDGYLVGTLAPTVGAPITGLLTELNTQHQGTLSIEESFPKIRWSGAWQDVQLTPMTVSDPHPVNGELTKLTDRSGSTKYTRKFSVPNLATNVHQNHLTVYDGVLVDIPLPEDLLLESNESLTFAMDADFNVFASKLNGNIGIKAWAFFYLEDVYGQMSSPVVKIELNTGTRYVPGDQTTVPDPKRIRQMGDFYYTGSGSGTTAVTIGNFGGLLGEGVRRKTIKTLCFKLIAEFSRSAAGYASSATSGIKMETQIDLYGIALYRRSNSYKGAKYHQVTGAKFGSSFSGRTHSSRSATDPVLTIPDAIEYIMRARDQAGAHVDTFSFDVAVANRLLPHWHIGRQIQEQKNSKDYITGLCKHGFLSLVPGPDGKRRLLPLDGYDNPGISATFDADTVIDGSVEDSPMSGLDRVFTGLELRYDKHPGTGDFRSALYIRKTDQPAFPAEATPLGDTEIPEWTEYAGGFKEYGFAKRVWEAYRRAYLLSHRENIYKMDCEWFQSNARLGGGLPLEDAPAYLAEILSNWYSGPRVPYTFRVPVTEENLQRLLLDRVLFADVRRTGNLYYQTLLEGLELDTARAQIRMTASRRAIDPGFPGASEAEPYYVTEIADGDGFVEVVGAPLMTEIIHP